MMPSMARAMRDVQGLGYAASVEGAATCVAAAGVLHFWDALKHLDVSGYALFLMLAGVAEVAWGLAFWRRPSTALQSVGVVLAGALIVLWVLARVLPAPFGHAHVDAVGVASKVAEGAGLAGLLTMVLQGVRSRHNSWSVGRTVATPLSLALIGALLLYGTGRAAELVFPWLGDRDGSVLGVGAGEARYDTIAVVENGAIRALENGDRVSLGEGVVAKVFFSPFPPQRRTDLHLYIVQNDESIQTAGAEVEAGIFMTQMDCEAYTRRGTDLHGGRYLLPLDFTMGGEWAINLRIGWAEKAELLRLMAQVGR